MKGKVEDNLPHIKQRLSLRYSTVDAVAGKSSSGAKELAQKNAGKYDIILSLGGDGTLHNVIDGVAKSGEKCIVGILPFGTCNDVSRTLGIPRDLDRALDCVLRLNTTKYDLMFDDEQYISYALASGYLTDVSFKTNQKIKKKVGRLAYVFAGLGRLFKVKKLPFTFYADNQRIHGKFIYVMLLNGKSAGGFAVDPEADLADGKVRFVAIKSGNGLGGINAFVKLFLRGIKSIRKNKNAIVMDVSKVTIENPSNEAFTLDGEKLKFLKKEIKVSASIQMITK